MQNPESIGTREISDLRYEILWAIEDLIEEGVSFEGIDCTMDEYINNLIKEILNS